MTTKKLGRAAYSAFRIGTVVRLTARGETPNFNDKVDFEQLPFLIFPPMFAFYFIEQDIQLPALRPFVYEEDVMFPSSARSIRIQDADGDHDVAITAINIPPMDAAPPAPTVGEFCVFQWIGTNKLLIAKCDAILPAVYRRVFGPASHADCEQYVREHDGTR